MFVLIANDCPTIRPTFCTFACTFTKKKCTQSRLLVLTVWYVTDTSWPTEMVNRMSVSLLVMKIEVASQRERRDAKNVISGGGDDGDGDG